MEVRIRCTFDDVVYESDEPDTFPTQTGGFCNPHNPYGDTAELTGDKDHDDELFRYVDEHWTEELTLWEAAEFILDFPGGVWDYTEGEYSTMDYRTGLERQVTAHVQDHTATVFEIADTIVWLRARSNVRSLWLKHFGQDVNENWLTVYHLRVAAANLGRDAWDLRRAITDYIKQTQKIGGLSL